MRANMFKLMIQLLAVVISLVLIAIILVSIVQCATYKTNILVINQDSWPKSRGIAINMKHYRGSASKLSICFIDPGMKAEDLQARGAELFYDEASDLAGRISRLSSFYGVDFDVEMRAKTILQFNVDTQNYLYDRVDGLLLFEH